MTKSGTSAEEFSLSLHCYLMFSQLFVFAAFTNICITSFTCVDTFNDIKCKISKTIYHVHKSKSSMECEYYYLTILCCIFCKSIFGNNYAKQLNTHYHHLHHLYNYLKSEI